MNTEMANICVCNAFSWSECTCPNRSKIWNQDDSTWTTINRMKIEWAKEREALIQDRESALDVTEETYRLIRKIIGDEFEDDIELKMYIRKNFLVEKEA